jgi:two-component system cell cycle response regulator
LSSYNYSLDDTAILNTKPSQHNEKKHEAPALIIINGPDTGKVHPLMKSTNFIGRDYNAEIIINDPAVSRKHVLIEVDQSNVCCIDLQSKNGTFVNFRRINKSILKEGDKIRVGYTLLRFSYQDSMDQRFQDDIYRMITFDELTSLYNYKYMLYQLDILIERAQRDDAFSILFADIDHFKKVNDKYGHLSGSKVLSELGQVLLSNTRSTDIACRYGGEEFVIILPDTPIKKSLFVGEKLRKVIENHRFSSRYNELIKISISIGLAGYDSSIKSSKDLIERADTAMYKAKQLGRNRVELIEPEYDSVSELMRNMPLSNPLF